MKKVFCFLFSMLLAAFVFAEGTHSKYEEFLKKNSEIQIDYGFESFLRLTFNDDSTFKITCFNQEVICKGTYTISGDTITINYPFTFTYDDEYFSKNLAEFGLNAGKSSQIKIDLDICNLFNKGAFISGDKIFWSYTGEPEPWKEYDYEGTKCIKYPLGENAVEIVIKENLRMRKTPSLKGEIVIINSWRNPDTEEFQHDKTCVLAGEEYVILAKTVKEDTIDGITGPWYLVSLYGNDYEGDGGECFLVWIFSGYVQEKK